MMTKRQATALVRELEAVKGLHKQGYRERNCPACEGSGRSVSKYWSCQACSGRGYFWEGPMMKKVKL